MMSESDRRVSSSLPQFPSRVYATKPGATDVFPVPDVADDTVPVASPPELLYQSL